MLEMMRGTPPPSWEHTCLKLSEEKRELQERIKRLEEDLMDAKNKHAALVADVALYEDRGERIKQLEAVTNDPHALWANWLRGSVTLPVGIGDVRQYQDRIKRLEDRIHRASNAFFADASDKYALVQMLQILEEERRQKS
jgi:cell division septum initiation protein DivIVA